MSIACALLSADAGPGVRTTSDVAGAERGARAGERPIDLVHLARQTFGDKRLETELLRMFIRQAEQIEASLDAEGPERLNRQSAADLLHLLLGSARVVGARHVATLAQRFEANLRRAGANRDALPQADRAQLRNALDGANRFIAELLGSP